MTGRWMSDARQAVRQLAKRPLFVGVAAGSLAIGIGANTAVFSVANAVLLRPLPGIAEPDRVVELGRTNRGSGFDTFSWPDFQDIRTEIPALDAAAAYTFELFSLSEEGEGLRAVGFHVTPSYFEVLGAVPALGRLLGPDEEEGFDAHPVAVVSHAYWRDHLGSNPDAVGATLRLNRTPYTIVGVTRPEFRGHVIGIAPDVYVPMTQVPSLGGRREDFDHRGASWHMALGRLSDGATLDELDAQLAGLASRLAQAYPGTNEHRSWRAVALGPVPGVGREGVRLFVTALLGMVALILLVTCTNVAGMFLARAVSREREVAVRLSLGAGRGALMRMLTLETLAVFVLGGGAGVFLGLRAVALIRPESLPAPVPIHFSLAPDLRVLSFAVVVTLATGLLFGLLPAARATRVDLARTLRDEGRGGGRRSARLRRGFAGAQVALSVILLVTAGLFVRSLQRAAAVDTGFDARSAWVTMMDLEIEGYDGESGPVFQERLLDALHAASWVQAASLSSDLPLDLGSSGTVVVPEGWEGDEPARGLGIEFNQVSTGYFEALGIPVLRGRAFDDGDGADAPRVVVVSEGFARAAWPDAPALGRTVSLGVRSDGGREEQVWEVVGVVPDVKNQVVTEVPEPFVYFPLAQRYASLTQVVVRTDVDGGEASRRLREAILALDPALSLGPVTSLGRYTGVGILPQRIAAGLTTALAALALLLSGLGLYGVVSFSVARERREIGIRMALGADRGSVVRRVLAGGLRLALPGVVVGGAAALLVGRALRALLLDLTPYDPLALGTVAALLLSVVLLATWVPARRAARVDPVDSLRAE